MSKSDEHLLDLPNELKYKMMMSLDYQSTKNLCATNKAMSDICNDPVFWRTKCFDNFPHISFWLKRFNILDADKGEFAYMTLSYFENEDILARDEDIPAWQEEITESYDHYYYINAAIKGYKQILKYVGFKMGNLRTDDFPDGLNDILAIKLTELGKLDIIPILLKFGAVSNSDTFDEIFVKSCEMGNIKMALYADSFSEPVKRKGMKLAVENNRTEMIGTLIYDDDHLKLVGHVLSAAIELARRDIVEWVLLEFDHFTINPIIRGIDLSTVPEGIKEMLEEYDRNSEQLAVI